MQGDGYGSAAGGSPALLDASIAQKTVEATASAVGALETQLARLLQRGYGFAFLTLGVLTVIAAIIVRFDSPHKFVVGIVAAILGVGLAQIFMAFAFFMVDLRTRAHTVQSLERQNEAITETLVAQAKTLEERQERAEGSGPPAGISA